MNGPNSPGDRPTSHAHVQGTRAGRDTIAVQNNYGAVPARGAAQTLLTLPSVDAGFTSRSGELERVLAVLDPEAEGVPGVVVSQGMGGVGKTQLALAAGHEALRRGWFAGALFVNLHGYTTPVDGDRAVESFLRGLDVPPRRWPDDAEARRGLYRSALEERALELGGPILVVADNASEAGQVAPLVPGRTRHRLLATSRDRLTSHGWRRVPIDHLPGDRAVRVLVEALRVGDPDDDRVTETEGLARVARACAGLPLALRVCAAVLAAAPDMTADELADTLEASATRVLRLGDGSRSLHAVFEQSRARLAPDTAELLALLGLAPGPDISTAAAAVLAGVTEPEVLERLRALSVAHLVSGREGRWRMHDLTAGYAASLCGGDEAPERFVRARRRLFDHYASTADDARLNIVALSGQRTPDTFADRAAATRWMDAERAVLIDTVHVARELGETRTETDLPLYLNTYLKWRRDFGDLEDLQWIAVRASQRGGDEEREAVSWDHLGAVLRATRRFEEAMDAHVCALRLYTELEDQHGEAVSRSGLGAALNGERRFEEAIDVLRGSQAMFARLGDVLREANACNHLGEALREVGRYAESVEAHQRARGFYHQLGELHREAKVWVNLGAVLAREGRFTEAMEAYERARTMFQGLGDTLEVVRTETGTATCLRGLHRTDEALAALDAVVGFLVEERDPHHEGLARYELGLTWAARGDAVRAIPHLERAVELLAENNDPYLRDRAAEALVSARDSPDPVD
ncbi:tetratricopeptide repeat protein [Nocardiopsis eucommiae]|uniref:tetratricopeptide repeat protein n=1 Tax=Nocardiopsis eucommiae TaxID=2831970 RepID=UPI003D70A689